MTTRKKILFIALLAALFVFGHSDGRVAAASRAAKFIGQTVYVPVYSHIYFGDKNFPFYLTATLSIRNTDAQYPLTITAVDYYDTAGKLLKKYVAAPVTLGALASMEHVVRESDKTGGSGANFIVRWRAAAPVSPPLIESVMISTKSSQGVSFTSRGQVIEETAE